MDERTDVIVVGAGNAALCAAIAARQLASSVVVLEKAKPHEFGGNSALTINMRFPYDDAEDLLHLLPPSTAPDFDRFRQNYSVSDFYDDLQLTSDGRSDPILAETLASSARDVIRWLHGLGQRFVVTADPIAGSVPLGMAGGGNGHQKRAYRIARCTGVSIRTNAPVDDLIVSGGRIEGVIARIDGVRQRIAARAVILACGGFEAEPDMRAGELGENWRSVCLRGVPTNTGDGLRMALDAGGVRHGDWTGCHATPIGAGAPSHIFPKEYLASRAWRRYGFPFGITVNRDGQRFFDEGATFRNLQYARVGRAILSQDQQVAFQLFDSTALRSGLLDGRCYEQSGGSSAGTWQELAQTVGIDGRALETTVRDYNAATTGRQIDRLRLDGVAAVACQPVKSNWAAPLDVPPFWAFPVQCGLTFTYGGIRVTPDAEVVNEDGLPIPGLYAAGEMIGGLFYGNYPGGSGMTSGSVFGYRAGRAAAEYAVTRSES